MTGAPFVLSTDRRENNESRLTVVVAHFSPPEPSVRDEQKLILLLYKIAEAAQSRIDAPEQNAHDDKSTETHQSWNFDKEARYYKADKQYYTHRESDLERPAFAHVGIESTNKLFPVVDADAGLQDKWWSVLVSFQVHIVCTITIVSLTVKINIICARCLAHCRGMSRGMSCIGY